MIPLMVNNDQVGIGFGVFQTTQYLGMGLMSLASGAIADHGWYYLEIFFSSVSFGKLFVAIKNDQIINTTSL